MKLEKKVALITGSGRGIGRTIAERFAREGATVVVADVNGDLAAATSKEIRANGATAHAISLDVTQPKGVDAAVTGITATFGSLDLLVNNAGIGLTRLLVDTTPEEWDRVVRVNLTGVFLCCRAAARAMIAQGGGRIINIASLSGQRGGTGRAAYGASKGGVTALTKVLAVELAQYGINVNEIAPGPVNTEMTAVTHDEATRQAYYNLIPMRRYAEREEIAAAAVFLASAEASFINGHTLNVDGGFRSSGLMFASA
jgi:NAD(P)-dependent dehydrogenase (short-subunit alcohol dehydrogenase family)